MPPSRRVRTEGSAPWRAAAAPLAGAATFGAWAWLAVGDVTAPADHQRDLRGDAAEPASRLIRAAVRGLRGDEGELFHFLAAAILVVLAAAAARRLSRPLAVYAVPATVVLFAAENLNSIERYALSVFPLVIAAALVSRSRWLDAGSPPPPASPWPA